MGVNFVVLQNVVNLPVTHHAPEWCVSFLGFFTPKTVYMTDMQNYLPIKFLYFNAKIWYECLAWE